MKLTLVILACLAIAGVNTASVSKKTKPMDKGMLNTQRFLLEIVRSVEEPLQFEEWIKFGGELIVDKSKYEKFDEQMMQFYETYKVGGLLPKGEFFSQVQQYHSQQAHGLFNFFYYAKDYDTFVRNVVWARLNVNEGMFVYALTLTIIHRPDTKGLFLPPIYEIFPQFFLNSKFVFQAEKFDSDVWNRQIMLEKKFKTIYDQENPTEEIFGSRFYLKDWKVWQWWKLMGLDEDFHREEKTLFRNNIDTFRKDPKYKAIWTDVKAYYMPVDYTRDVEIFNDESKLSYFTEDLGWNAYWYYLNMDYASFLSGKEFHLDKDRRGEFWIYNVQQLLARYYMERLSNGFGEIDELSFYDGIIKTGYDPQLISYNGEGYTFRKNYYEFESYQNLNFANKLVRIERRIQDIIDSGKFVTKDGLEIDFTKPESIEHIGNLMQGNIDILDKNFFGYWYAFATSFLAGEDYTSFTVVPNVLLNFETMLRDPVTYHLFKRIVDVYYKFKNQLPPYKREEVVVPDIKILNVEVSKLKTFFDLVDVDVTNLVNDELTFADSKFVWDTSLFARQLRLNHKVFDLTFNVQADKAGPVVVRTFLAPDFDQFGQKIDLFQNVENFFEIDEFYYEFVVGENVFKRSSKDFSYTISDKTTYTELYKYVMLAYDGKQEFPNEISQAHCGFPDRLLLPKGWVNGLPVKFFFIITPFTAHHKQFSIYEPAYTCGIGSGVRHIDDYAFGFPFDRKIDNIYQFYGPNMYVKDVKIFHTDKYEKYYPKKYEYFGTFDYSY